MIHFLNISDISSSDIEEIITQASVLKTTQAKPLANKAVGMIFEKPSNRTRLSFEVGVHQLGGKAVYIKGDEIQMGDREPISHVSRVMSRYFDMIVYRTKDHLVLEEFAKYASVPVINGLSDQSHPCQAVADALTIKNVFGGFEEVFLTYVGDGNNVCRSLMEIAVKCGFKMAVVSPRSYAPNSVPEGIILTDSINEVIERTNVLYTDVWVSMGDEAQAKQRLNDFSLYQISEDMMSRAKDDVIFLHCLPANLGQEVTHEVFESPASRVFDQAENRLHAQNAIMNWLMKGN
ncbi:MAG: ornithine carbamoyltransferase [Candidatus Margulisiibacteriota bacterium]